MDRHYSPEELNRYDRDLELGNSSPEIDAHVNGCDACAEILAQIRAFDRSLRDEETWHFADELLTAGHQRQLDDLTERLTQEDEEAERMLRGPLASPFRFLWSNIPRKQRYRTGGVVRVLARASAAARESNPLHALNLADAAIAVAEALPADHYPARGVYHLVGLAWKERANACRYLTRYEAAHEACDHAERAYRRLLSHDLEMAVIQYVRGTVLWEQQRLDQALVAARAAAAAFSDRRDHERWINARLLEGSILGDLHASEAARDIFLALASDMEAMDNKLTRARITMNLGNTHLGRGEIGEATRHFLDVLRLYESLGIAVEATRARWRIAVVAMVSGNAADAVRRLRAVKTEFESLEILGDAALVGLDLTEGLLSVGDHAAARRVAADVLTCVKAAGMAPAALAAAAFLRDAAESGALTPRAIAHVRGFLRMLQAQPHLTFEGPPDPAVG